MKDIKYKIIKKFSNRDFSVKDNLKIFRTLQKMINPVKKESEFKDVFLNLKTRKIKIRIYNDFEDKKDHKMILYFHGGGWVSGSLESYTNVCYELSKKTNRIVLLVEYRLAPEYPFPAGFEDCYEIAHLLIKNCKAFNLEPKDIVLMGDSAGGNLVAAISQKARDTKDFKIDKNILLYPALQNDYSLNSKYKSLLENGSDYMLTRKNIEEFMDLYTENEKDKLNPYAAPLLQKDFKNLPKTLIITCELDPLRDEGREYVEKLKESNNEVNHIEYKGALHGFFSNILEKNYRIKMYEDIQLFLGEENE
ncbi:MAG: alpha/beta hydrolase [Bacilli bacterium]